MSTKEQLEAALAAKKQELAAKLKDEIAKKQAEAFDLSNVQNGQKPVNFVPNEPPAPVEKPVFTTPEEFYSNQINQKTSARNEVEKNISTLSTRQSEEFVNSGLADDKLNIEQDQLKLQGLEDHNTTLDIQEAQKYRDAGVVGTKSDVSRSTSQEKQDTSLQSLALSRKITADATVYNANLSQLTAKYEGERDSLTFELTEKNRNLEAILSQQSDYLSKKEAFDLEQRKHENELEILGVKADYDLRVEASKKLTGAGYDFNEVSNMSTAALMNASSGISTPRTDLEEVEYQKALASLNKTNLEISEKETAASDKIRAEIATAGTVVKSVTTILDNDNINKISGLYKGIPGLRANDEDYQSSIAASKTLLYNLTSESVANLKARLGSAGGQITEAEWVRFDSLSGELANLAQRDKNNNFTGQFKAGSEGRVPTLIKETGAHFYKNLILAEDKDLCKEA